MFSSQIIVEYFFWFLIKGVAKNFFFFGKWLHFWTIHFWAYVKCFVNKYFCISRKGVSKKRLYLENSITFELIVSQSCVMSQNGGNFGCRTHYFLNKKLFEEAKEESNPIAFNFHVAMIIHLTLLYVHIKV